MPPIDCPMPADFICRRLNISRTTFWRWRKAGLPVLTVGGKLFVRETQVIHFMERMSQQPKGGK